MLRCAGCDEPLASDLFEPLWVESPDGTIVPASALRLSAFPLADGLEAWHHGCLPAERRASLIDPVDRAAGGNQT